jgi:hypothetical protein
VAASAAWCVQIAKPKTQNNHSYCPPANCPLPGCKAFFVILLMSVE